MDNTSSDNNSNNTNRVLLLLLIVSLIANAYLFTSKTNLQESYTHDKDSLITSRKDVEIELSETYTELNQYKGISTRLDSLLKEANTKVNEEKNRIELLIRREGNSASLNKKLKAELEELKKLRDSYLEKIDALLVENEQLKKEKNELSSTVEMLSKNLDQP